jgi:ribokinase
MASLTTASKLVCYGDLCVDIFVSADNFPQPGQDAVVREMSLLPAGSAANCAVTAARLGIPTSFLGVTGHDGFANMLVDDLVANGVNIEHLRQIDAPTGVTIAILGPERTFMSFRGANAYPTTQFPAISSNPVIIYIFRVTASRTNIPEIRLLL